MSSRSLSPGGALLRTSRLFSVPAPLDPPRRDVDFGRANHSDSATRPYPTHQVLTTPPELRRVGEWGLKRRLPLSTTAARRGAAAPFVRVNHMDLNLVTDFAHAADHAVTLRKFQELNLPITIPRRQRIPGMAAAAEKSVFEDATDVTTPRAAGDGADGDAAPGARWAFRGPGIVGMREGEFEKYVRDVVRRRKPEFRQFLRRRLVKEQQQQQQSSDAAAADVDTTTVTDAQLAAHIRDLQNDPQTLHRLVSDFLDLPPLAVSDQTFPLLSARTALSLAAQSPSSGSSTSSGASRGIASTPPGQRVPVSTAPLDPATGLPLLNPFTGARGLAPLTHPSAGLSYLRTSAALANHPSYGPQRDGNPGPVLARVLQPRGTARGATVPKLGVAGFVTDVPDGEGRFGGGRAWGGRGATAAAGLTAAALGGGGGRVSANAAVPGLALVDPDVKGGHKVFVRPRAAAVDARGRLHLAVGQAGEEARLVLQELTGEGVEEESEEGVKARQERDEQGARMQTPQTARQHAPRTRVSSSANYGMSL